MERAGNNHFEWGKSDPEGQTFTHFLLLVDVAFESSDMCVSLYIHRGLKISKEPWVGGSAFKKEELEFGGIKC